jgi:hypothetical protein
MGGFTKIKLKDTTETNIDKCNESLKTAGVAMKYHFHSEGDVRYEWEWYKTNPQDYPTWWVDRYGRNMTFEQFSKAWHPDVLGEVFVPHIGTLVCDCYFGRMSQRAMTNLMKWVVANAGAIKEVGGSFSTLVEKSGVDIRTIDHYSWYKKELAR